MCIDFPEILNALKFAVGDAITFPALQVLLFMILLYAFVTEQRWFIYDTGASATVVRGEKSWPNFHIMYGVVSVLFVQVISTADALKGFKTIVTIADLLALFYLCFFNSWFRNKIMDTIVASQTKVER